MSKYDFWDELGRIFNAVVAYQEKTVEFNDRFITPWIKMGNVFDKQDRNKEAVSAYQNAIAIDPSNAKNWFELGNIYFQMSDFESAADAYKKSTELSPESGWAHSNLALTLASQGKYEESISLYQKGIELLEVDKDKAVAWNRLGNAYRKLNNYQLAMNAFTEADKYDSENAGFRDELDEVSDGPGVVEEADPESLSGSEVVELIQAVLETEQKLEDASQETVGIDPELGTDTQNADVQIVPEEVVAMDVDPQSELMPEADMQTQADTVTEEISASDLQNDLVEVTEAKTEETVEIDVVQEMDADAPAAILESADEVGQGFENDLDAEDVTQPEPDAQPNSAEPVAQRSILEIVEAVIAKVLAESEAGKEASVELEAVLEQPVTTEEAAEEAESPALVTEEKNESDETVVAAVEQLISGTSPEVEAETLDQPVAVPELIAEDQPEAESLEVSTDTTNEDPGHDEALELIAQNTSETFTDNLFVTTTETDISDASLPTPESNDDLSSEAQVEERALELPVAEQAAPAASVNVAYEEYLNDSNGHFKISVNESGQENDPAEESFLPAELLAKIDLAGDLQIESDAKSAHVWNELGNVYFNSGAYEDAVIAYSKSIELDRQFAWPYSNLALVYVQKGRFAEAMLLYQRSIELFSNDKDKAISWNRLGNVYRRVSDYDNAISAYQRADELDTDNTTLSLQSRFSLLGNYYMENKTSYAA